jgi:hypothetical protein
MRNTQPDEPRVTIAREQNVPGTVKQLVHGTGGRLTSDDHFKPVFIRTVQPEFSSSPIHY